MFDGVTDVDRVPAQTRVMQCTIEYSSGGAYERMSLQVLLIAWCFTDEHEF
jgi:hypothetical protein